MQENNTAVRAKSYDSFDLFKIIISFVVMIVHTRIFGDSRFHWLHPWCRIAIPVYFMISSFLFFSKYDRLPDDEKNSYLRKFVKRDLTLYLFWFIVFLPFTIIYRDCLHKGIAFFFGMILLGSSFPASWYLIALVIGIPPVSGTEYLADPCRQNQFPPEDLQRERDQLCRYFFRIHHLDLDGQAFCHIQ